MKPLIMNDDDGVDATNGADDAIIYFSMIYFTTEMLCNCLCRITSQFHFPTPISI